MEAKLEANMKYSEMIMSIKYWQIKNILEKLSQNS